MSDSRPQLRPRPATRALRLLALMVTAAALLCVVLSVPVLDVLAGLFLLAELLVLLLWLIGKALRRLLWRVGRRLAITYFLIGVVPIPLVAAMVFVAAYLLSGFFLGHLYRDAMAALHEELHTAAAAHLTLFEAENRAPARNGPMVFAYYDDGRRVAGDERAPGRWPAWLSEIQGGELTTTDQRAVQPVLLSLEDRQSLGAAVERNGRGALALFDDDLELDLSRRAGIWIDLLRSDDPLKEVTTLQVFGEKFVLQPLKRPGSEADREEFLRSIDPDPALNIIGFELAGPLYELDGGAIASPSVSATLTATPAIVRRHLFPSSAEVDTLAWLGFILPAFLLFDIYAVAALMAVLLILSLSRALNRLSKATNAVQAGDLTTRIPVRRRDQIGALQTSFNKMAENLEELLADVAKKERLEKELEIARDLQESLLPAEVAHDEAVAFSTFFEPSAAIGGDYFDIFWLDKHAGARRIAVVIADVSGHGLSAGLGMAMVKAALLILMDQGREPEYILSALDRLVRSSQQKSFVTATLALLDLDSGELELTNAGHPPTYLLRDGEVREILLPGPPLGALGNQYPQLSLYLEPGDILIWLSDGFIEATGSDGESFGYDRTCQALRGDGESAASVRDRFLEAVRRHADDQVAEDDCTLVVMHYQPAGQASRPLEEVAEAAAR